MRKKKPETPTVTAVVLNGKHNLGIGIVGGAIVLCFIFSLLNLQASYAISDRVSSLARVTEAVHRNYHLEEKEWSSLYDSYNLDYFSGSLPSAIVESADDIGTDVFGQTSFDKTNKPHIQMNALTLYGDKEARATLLHEMIHVKLKQGSQPVKTGTTNGIIFWSGYGGDDHNEEFMKELHRLETLGAFDNLIG